MDPAVPESLTLSNWSRIPDSARIALAAGVLLAILSAGCLGGVREIYAGVRFFPTSNTEWPTGPVAYYERVPLLISQDPNDPNWVTMDRLLQIRDELGVRHRRDDVLSIVHNWDAPHDTIGSLRWERNDGYVIRCLRLEGVPACS